MRHPSLLKTLGDSPEMYDVFMNIYYIQYRCKSFNIVLSAEVQAAVLAFLKVYHDKGIYGTDLVDLFR
jgi:hypothetical protein